MKHCAGERRRPRKISVTKRPPRRLLRVVPGVHPTWRRFEDPRFLARAQTEKTCTPERDAGVEFEVLVVHELQNDREHQAPAIW